MTIGVDAPPVVDEQEAQTLLLHHLKLAAMYFEASPVDLMAALPGDEFSLPAMTAWVSAMEALYPEED